jgi:LCP family protein required for cell wall assembly
MNRFHDEVQIEGFTPEQVSIASEHHDLQFDEEGFLNVAVFGDDSRGGEDSRTDTIMIASLNLDTSEVRLVSIFRDTLLELDKGFLDKAAHAYAFGGSQAAVSMLNRNLDLNIQHFVTVDFTATALIVDSLGGVEIDVLDSELRYINELSYQMIVEGEYDINSGFVVPGEINSHGINH